MYCFHLKQIQNNLSQALNKAKVYSASMLKAELDVADLLGA